MQLQTAINTLAITLGLLLASGCTSTMHPKGADNTSVNEKDRGSATADQQGMSAADQEMSAEIRKSIMADKFLSSYAQHIKIITQSGMVTLKGPVRSDEEVKTVLAKAVGVAGDAGKVANELSVEPSKP